MNALLENNLRTVADQLRLDDAKVTRTTLSGGRDRKPIFRVTFIPHPLPATNTKFPRAAPGGEDSGRASASNVLLLADSAQRHPEVDATAWQRFEFWAARTLWTVVTITLLVDIVATFGHGFGLPWRM